MTTQYVPTIPLRPSSAASVMVLACALTSCAGPPPPPPPPPVDELPLPPALRLRMYTAILERVLVSDMIQWGEPVTAICLGLGEAATPPSADLLLRFAGGEPPLYGSNGCTRSIDPVTELAVIQTTEGAPALFVTLVEASDRWDRMVLVRIDKTGWATYTLRCRVEMDVLGVAAGDATPPPELLLANPSAVTWRVRRC